jgi:MYXO-CTERM domain-containing protein
VTASALADFAVEAAPTWRGDANTAYYNWETFTSADGYNDGPNFPGNVPGPPSGDALLFNFGTNGPPSGPGWPGTGAVIASSGNIYGNAGQLNIHAYGYGNEIQDVVFNAATFGTQIDFDSVQLALEFLGGAQTQISLAELGLVNYTEDFPAPGPPGNVATLDNISWSYDLSGYSDVTGVGLIFTSDTTNMSLDAFSMDLRFAAIPSPGALALFGLAGLAGRRRRRA